MTNPDKTPPALPKAGEVWVEMRRGYPFAVCRVREVYPNLRYVLTDWRSCKTPESGARIFGMRKFATMTKRAVRVDDKERGR